MNDPLAGKILAMDRTRWEAIQARRAAVGGVARISTPEARGGGRVALLPITGPIEQHGSEWLYYFGGTSTDVTGLLFDSMLRDAAVKAIVLNIDSPGGSVPGTPELAQKIYNARGRKPIVAVANSMAASAALWIGSAATEFIVTPSGEVGSHGVWTAHVDNSKAIEAEGRKVTIIQAGKYKTEGNPWEPLGNSAKDEMQRGVDAIYSDFTRDLAKHRSVSVQHVLSRFGQGRMLFAKDALGVGMVDGIATMEEVINRLAAGEKSLKNKSQQLAARLQSNRAEKESDSPRARRITRLRDEQRIREMNQQAIEKRNKFRGQN